MGTVASKTFYNCYKVKLPGQTLPITFNNVWVIQCVQDLCTNAPVFNMQTQAGPTNLPLMEKPIMWYYREVAVGSPTAASHCLQSFIPVSK